MPLAHREPPNLKNKIQASPNIAPINTGTFANQQRYFALQDMLRTIKCRKRADQLHILS
jgi:hypothetical protein